MEPVASDRQSVHVVRLVIDVESLSKGSGGELRIKTDHPLQRVVPVGVFSLGTPPHEVRTLQ